MKRDNTNQQNVLVQFRPDKKTLENILSRTEEETSLGLTARADLHNYYTLLQRELRTLARRFTEEQALFLCWHLQGPSVTEAIQYASEEADLKASEILSEHNGDFDHPEVFLGSSIWYELPGDLNKLTPGQAYALVDAAKRWRLLPEEDRDETGLAQVGLIVKPE